MTDAAPKPAWPWKTEAPATPDWRSSSSSARYNG
jgi:hypothetical protein